MVIEITRTDDESFKNTERVQFFEGKSYFFALDEHHPKGYYLIWKEKLEGKCEIEFKLIKDQKYVILSPTNTDEY